MHESRPGSKNDSVEDKCAEYGDILDAAFDAGLRRGEGLRHSELHVLVRI